MTVTAAVASEVMVRDRFCFLLRLDGNHQCRDQWGHPHSSWDLEKLSFEHVKQELRMGKRAESDAAHLVLLCRSNNGPHVVSKDVREAMRSYLAAYYPDVWGKAA